MEQLPPIMYEAFFFVSSLVYFCVCSLWVKALSLGLRGDLVPPCVVGSAAASKGKYGTYLGLQNGTAVHRVHSATHRG